MKQINTKEYTQTVQ